jgi:hypothetical protein
MCWGGDEWEGFEGKFGGMKGKCLLKFEISTARLVSWSVFLSVCLSIYPSI